MAMRQVLSGFMRSSHLTLKPQSGMMGLLVRRGEHTAPDPSDDQVEHIHVHKDKSKGVATVHLARPPVNSLNLDFMMEFNTIQKNLEYDKKIRGMIVTSDIPSIFSAGIEIPYLLKEKQSREEMTQFWNALLNIWEDLYSSRLVTIAAINGHALAYGCVVATLCDSRIMAKGPHQIGLAETKGGIWPPFWIWEPMARTTGWRITEKATQLGQTFSPEEAMHIGLVDKVVPPGQLMESAMEEITTWLQVPDFVRVKTKKDQRRDLLHHFKKYRHISVDEFVDHIREDETQKHLTEYYKELHHHH